jgi:hypothetical protein
MLKAGVSVGESWSGSCFGYHSDLHYGRFERPPFHNRFSVEWGCINGMPNGWAPRTPDEVKTEIERRSKDTFEDLEKTDAGLMQQVKTLRDEITMELSPLYSRSDVDREQKMLTELEEMKWDEHAQKEHVVNGINSSPNMTRDFGAISEGRRVPSHTFYEGTAIGVEAHCDLTHKFWGSTKRLLKQLQIKADTAKPAFDPKQYEIHLDEKAGGGPSGPSYVFSGDNTRVNINSHDRSVNVIIKADNVFAGLKDQIEDHVAEENERTLLLKHLESLRQAKGTKSFSERYQEFIAAAADHITLIAPFIPTLTQFLGN